MFTFGSDPEFCVYKDNQLFSAIGIVSGTKEEKLVLNGSSFYYDNVLAECNVKPGATKKEVLENIRQSILDYHKIISPYKLFCVAAIEYPQKQLLHPEALKIACDPEYCCYDLSEHRPDKDLFKTVNIRTSGGHIHVGSPLLQTVSSINRYRFIRMMDLFVGIPSVFLDNDETSKNRRKIYGEPGRFRKQAHGAEYRSLSNFWLIHPNLTEIIYDLTEIALNIIDQKKDYDYWTIDLESLYDEEKWKEPNFSPASCHTCHYDLELLKQAIKEQDHNKAKVFLDLIKPHISNELFDSILKPNQYSKDLERNWS